MHSILNCLSVSKHIGLIVWPFNIGKPPAQYCVSMQCLILKVSNSTFIYFPTHHPHIFSSRCWTYWVLLFLFWRILCVLLVLVACVTISFTSSSGKHTHKRLSMGQFCSSLDDLIYSCPFLESFKPFSWMLREKAQSLLNDPPVLHAKNCQKRLPSLPLSHGRVHLGPTCSKLRCLLSEDPRVTIMP